MPLEVLNNSFRSRVEQKRQFEYMKVDANRTIQSFTFEICRIDEFLNFNLSLRNFY